MFRLDHYTALAIDQLVPYDLPFDEIMRRGNGALDPNRIKEACDERAELRAKYPAMKPGEEPSFYFEGVPIFNTRQFP
jgi:hypothetical protein